MLTYKSDKLFCSGKNDEGYKYLEDAYKNFAEWTDIPDGTPLDVGHDWMFHGVKVLKNKWDYRLADGTKEYSNYMCVFADQRDFLAAVMKNHKNWDGFNLVRNEDRFSGILLKAEILAAAPRASRLV